MGGFREGWRKVKTIYQLFNESAVRYTPLHIIYI